MMQASIEEERIASASAGVWDMFKMKNMMLYRLVLGIIMQSLQQLTGDNYFFYYGTTIFQSVGLDDSFETSIILGTVNFLFTFVSFFVVDRFGRRNVLLSGSCGMAVCLLIFCCVGTKSLYSGKFGVNPDKGSGDAMIVFTCLFIAFFAVTWAPVTFVVVSETYPLRVRARAMSIASAANWIWGFLIAFFTPLITNNIHFAYGYVFFGCVIFSLFFVFFCVPETKGLSLEEVDEMYAHFVPGAAFASHRNHQRRKNSLSATGDDGYAPDANQAETGPGYNDAGNATGTGAGYSGQNNQNFNDSPNAGVNNGAQGTKY
ncbi:unnamed protein product [Ambrosiozyma monospora]|uniref:Unnamed protein product n=1 Tax=Ambrosiozyma monospora TaxID=43982 RepID=A0A9W6Z4B3_AMBMO|nr:unnamed protein product [Ambrosiozyma monospora]